MSLTTGFGKFFRFGLDIDSEKGVFSSVCGVFETNGVGDGTGDTILPDWAKTAAVKHKNDSKFTTIFFILNLARTTLKLSCWRFFDAANCKKVKCFL